MKVPKSAAFLGNAVEIGIETDKGLLEGKFPGTKGKAWYFLGAYHPRSEKYSILLVPMSIKGKRPTDSEIDKNMKTLMQADRLFGKFMGFGPANVTSVLLPDYKLKKLGVASHIVYRSHKWTGSVQDYIHDFDESVEKPNVYVNKSSGGKKLPKIMMLYPVAITAMGIA